MSKIVTLDEWIDRFKKIHGDFYSYSKVIYNGARNKICIICPKHGEFWQTPHNHANGQGCPICASEENKKRLQLRNLKAREEFIAKARKVHNDKYDYSKTEYKNSNEKVCIICPIHGEFWQKPHNHLNGNGCPKCDKSFKINKNIFIERAKKVHGDKYDYSKVEYNGNKEKVCIVCPIHGEFWQRPNDHLTGHGCHECNCHNHTKKFCNFLKLANAVHENKYTYDESTYRNRSSKVRIICPEHGEFWQNAAIHLQGNGCPKCGNKCNISEQKVYMALVNAFPNEEILYQYRNTKLLGLMSLDIFLPKYNIAIEHQGIQHFEPVKRFGGFKKLEKRKKLDALKKEICIKNGITLYYVSLDAHTWKYSSNDARLIHTITELIEEITKKVTM